MKAEAAQSPDLFIAVARDISIAAPDFRKFVEDFFNDLFSSGIYLGKGRVEIDAAQWQAKSQRASPKCVEVDLFVNGSILRAFGLIQADESATCVRIVLGELFGLINTKKYYIDHDQDVPIDLIATATRTLYDKRVIAGSSQAEAEKVAGELCK